MAYRYMTSRSQHICYDQIEIGMSVHDLVFGPRGHHWELKTKHQVSSERLRVIKLNMCACKISLDK